MAYVEINQSTALKIIKDGGEVYIKNNCTVVNDSIDSSESIGSFLEFNAYFKKLEAKINGKTFGNKADALNAINEIFGE